MYYSVLEERDNYDYGLVMDSGRGYRKVVFDYEAVTICINYLEEIGLLVDLSDKTHTGAVKGEGNAEPFQFF